jgi:N-acetylglucosamine-6-phosphate deacetylase
VARKGAHNPKLIRNINLNELKKISAFTKGVTKILAVAPENKNNLSLIPKLTKEYFISIGHSAADYKTAMKAFDLGAKRIVHLYNAMPDFDKRHPTILNAIFNRNDLYCELICDKAHVSSEVILNTYKILGTNQILIISDSLLTKGLKNGKYNVWNAMVEKRGMLGYLPGTNNIAGGNLPYNLQVENFGNITKCSMNDILKVSSLNAAKSLKQDTHFGNLVVGAADNFVLLNRKYQLKKIFINNK